VRRVEAVSQPAVARRYTPEKNLRRDGWRGTVLPSRGARRYTPAKNLRRLEGIDREAGGGWGARSRRGAGRQRQEESVRRANPPGGRGPL